MKRSFICFILSVCVCIPAVAATTYVSDRLKINMRTGTSNNHRITATLRSGTALTVLAVDKASGYTQVRTTSGKTGWVLSRQLDKKPSARNSLISAQNTIAQLQTELSDITQKFTQTSTEYHTINQSLQETLSENKILSEELTDIRQKASSALFIEKERNALRDKVSVTQIRLEELEQQNQILADSDRNVLFMLGAGTVIFGFFLGLILPKLGERKRRTSWGNDSYFS